jgi:poly(A) polymerase
MGQLSAERVGGEMRRMLGLPKVGNTLKAMVEAELLALPPAVLDDLIIYERRARRPDRIARLALILSKTGVEPLKDRWRLANDEITNAEAILRVAALLMDFDVNEAAYRFPASIADGVDIAAVLAGWTEAGKSAVLEQLQGLDVPRFPLTGGDLIARGFHPGKALGTELERLERKWIESGFVLDRQRLLSEIRR